MKSRNGDYMYQVFSGLNVTRLDMARTDGHRESEPRKQVDHPQSPRQLINELEIAGSLPERESCSQLVSEGSI